MQLYVFLEIVLKRKCYNTFYTSEYSDNVINNNNIFG